MNKLITIIFLVSLTVLAVVHYIALKFYLYWTIPILDIPVHFLGGATMVMALFALRNLSVPVPSALLSRWGILLYLILITVSWEVFQFSITEIMKSNYVQDTVTDIFVGMIGGVFGWWFSIKIKFLD